MWSRICVVLAITLVVLGRAGADPLDDAKKDIIAKQGQVHSLTAKITTTNDATEDGVILVSSKETGVIEYLEKGETVYFREEISLAGYITEDGKKQDIKGTSLFVSDGVSYFAEQKQDGETTVSKMNPQNLPLHFLGAEEILDNEAAPLVLLPEGSFGDRKVYVFQTQDEGEDSGKIKYSFDKENGVLLKIEGIEPDGALFSCKEYTDVKINQKMDESRFKYSPPKGVNVIEVDDEECGVE